MSRPFHTEASDKTTAAKFQDDKITKEEWFKMWTECIRATNTPNDLPDWQRKYMDFMFEVNDTSGLLDGGFVHAVVAGRAERSANVCCCS